LAFVEVSSDGATFARFDSLYLGAAPLGAWGANEAAWIEGLAGKYRVGYGTPFDLAALTNAPEVRAGAVDLAAIRFVRLVDVIGDGRDLDSFGHPIYDPYPTATSAGFDLDAIGWLHN